MWIGCNVDLVPCGLVAVWMNLLLCECVAVCFSCSVGQLQPKLFAIWIGCKVNWLVAVSWYELATLWIGCIVFYKYIPKSPLHLFCQNISFISTDCNHEHSFIEKVKTCPKEAQCGDNYLVTQWYYCLTSIHQKNLMSIHTIQCPVRSVNNIGSEVPSKTQSRDYTFRDI